MLESQPMLKKMDKSGGDGRLAVTNNRNYSANTLTSYEISADGTLNRSSLDIDHLANKTKVTGRHRSRSFLGGFHRQRYKMVQKVNTIAGDLGRIKLSIWYSDTRKRLAVSIQAAESLLPLNSEKNVDAYAKISMVINEKQVMKHRTATVRDCVNPQWQETFEFNLPPGELKHYAVQVVVKDATNYGYGAFRAAPVLGQIRYDLAAFDLLKPVDEWFDLGPAGHKSANISSNK